MQQGIDFHKGQQRIWLMSDRWRKSLRFLLALCMVVTLTVFTVKWSLWSLLAEIVTTADRFQKTRRSCKRTDFSSLDWLHQRALVLLGLPKAQMELSDGAEDLCEKWRSDISVLHETVSKIKGTWKQTIQTVISLVLTKKQKTKKNPKKQKQNKKNNKKQSQQQQQKSLSFPLSLSHLYSKNALFFASEHYAYLITHFQAFVGVHCSTHTFMIFLKICFLCFCWFVYLRQSWHRAQDNLKSWSSCLRSLSAEITASKKIRAEAWNEILQLQACGANQRIYQSPTTIRLCVGLQRERYLQTI